MNQLKEDLIWIALGIPGMVLIGLVLHSLVHFESDGEHRDLDCSRRCFRDYFVLLL